MSSQRVRQNEFTENREKHQKTFVFILSDYLWGIWTKHRIWTAVTSMSIYVQKLKNIDRKTLLSFFSSREAHACFMSTCKRALYWPPCCMASPNHSASGVIAPVFIEFTAVHLRQVWLSNISRKLGLFGSSPAFPAARYTLILTPK
jgi:hypothetical protein